MKIVVKWLLTVQGLTFMLRLFYLKKKWCFHPELHIPSSKNRSSFFMVTAKVDNLFGQPIQTITWILQKCTTWGFPHENYIPDATRTVVFYQAPLCYVH